jgi:hypothetical protein
VEGHHVIIGIDRDGGVRFVALIVRGQSFARSSEIVRILDEAERASRASSAHEKRPHTRPHARSLACSEPAPATAAKSC